MRQSLLAALACASLTVLAAGPGAAQPAIRTMVVEQQPPVLNRVDFGAPGHSHGDMLAFEAAIKADDGSSGVLFGLLITVDLPDAGGDLFEDRTGQLVFDLGDGNSLVVAGASAYSASTVEMNADHPQVRAVVGGTGRFLGARGQVTTTRAAAGTYTHRFELLD